MKKKPFLASAAFLLIMAFAPIANAYNGAYPDPGPGGNIKNPPKPVCYPNGICIYP